MNTIDMTPTWVALVPVLIHIAAELSKMARAADHWNAHCKASK